MPVLELASTCSTKRFVKQRRREREMSSAGSMLGLNRLKWVHYLRDIVHKSGSACSRLKRASLD
jgi:hypothetical protein